MIRDTPNPEKGRTNDDEEEGKKKPRPKFPKNPDDLLDDLTRDEKGRIQTADNLRISPEKHEMKPGDVYNPRHHGQHYHVETRKDPSGRWQHNNIILPP